MADLTTLSLFTGAGGLDLGLEAAGFRIVGCVERDVDARKTISDNTDWPLAAEPDLEAAKPPDLLAEFGLHQTEVTVLAGGPPCQPFSKSGQWRLGTVGRMRDPRATTLHAYLDVAEAALPQVMLLENVKGIAYVEQRPGQEEHALEVLRDALELINKRHSTAYEPHIIFVDAADYGVPQHRERALIVATRDGRQLQAPPATHDGRLRARATAWDAIGDLEDEPVAKELKASGKWAELLPSIPEGSNYQFHTDRGDGEPLFGYRTRYWSFLLKLAKSLPSWTLQAQAGPATGPFHWRNRRLSLREMARLQTFPDDHDFAGGYTSGRRQIGNAVPVALGEAVGLHIRRDALDEADVPKANLATPPRPGCPDPSEPAAVPERFLRLKGNHQRHPGVGKGPGALAMNSSGDSAT